MGPWVHHLGQWGGYRGQGPPFQTVTTVSGTREAVQHSGKQMGSGLRLV